MGVGIGEAQREEICQASYNQLNIKNLKVCVRFGGFIQQHLSNGGITCYSLSTSSNVR